MTTHREELNKLSIEVTVNLKEMLNILEPYDSSTLWVGDIVKNIGEAISNISRAMYMIDCDRYWSAEHLANMKKKRDIDFMEKERQDIENKRSYRIKRAMEKERQDISCF